VRIPEITLFSILNGLSRPDVWSCANLGLRCKNCSPFFVYIEGGSPVHADGQPASAGTLV